MTARRYPLQVVIQGTDKVSKVLADIEGRMKVFNTRISRPIAVPLRRFGRSLQRVGQGALGIGEQIGINAAARGTLALGRSLANVARASGQVAASLGRMTLAAGASAAAFLAMVRASALAGDEVAKTSRRLGLGAAQLQAWRYGAVSSGIAVGTFDGAIQALGRRVAEAANGFGKGREALAALGIELRGADGRLRPLAAILPEVADRLKAVQSASARNALAARLFGDEGIMLVQMLEKGSAGLRQFEARARELGVVMGEQQVAASERFGDTLGDLGFALRGLRDTVAGAALPALQRLTERLTELVVRYRPQIAAFTREFMAELPARLGAVRDAFATLWQRLEPLREILGRLVERYGEVNVALGAVGLLAAATAAGPLMALASSMFGVLGSAVNLGVVLGGIFVKGLVAGGKALRFFWTIVQNGTPLGRMLSLVGLLAAAVAALNVDWSSLGRTIVNALRTAWGWVEAFYRKVKATFDALRSIVGLGPDAAPAEAANAAGRGTTNSRASRLAGAATVSQRARVEIDFRNVPDGVDVRLAPGATADVDLRMGLALGGGM